MSCFRSAMRFCIGAVLALLFVAMVPSATAAFKYLREGMPAPSIEGTDLITAETVKTDKWLPDNMVIVVFWATWSQRSIEELQDLKAIALKYQTVPLKILAVNVDGQKLTSPQKKQIMEIIDDLDLPFPAIIDEDLESFYKFGVIAVPSTAIIDSTGTLRYGPAGYSLTTRDLIVDSIEVLAGLKEPTKDSVVIDGYRPIARAGRYYNMALNQINRRQYKNALTNLDKAEGIDSGFAGPHILRGELFLAMDSIDAACISFARAVSLDSGSVVAVTGLGSAYLEKGLLDSAYTHLEAALKMDNTYTPAALNFGLCLAEMGRLPEALDSVLKARDLNMGNPTIHYYLGRLYLQQGDTTRTVEAFRKALELLFPAP